jgi:hypothetical protein
VTRLPVQDRRSRDLDRARERQQILALPVPACSSHAKARKDCCVSFNKRTCSTEQFGGGELADGSFIGFPGFVWLRLEPAAVPEGERGGQAGGVRRLRIVHEGERDLEHIPGDGARELHGIFWRILSS